MIYKSGNKIFLKLDSVCVDLNGTLNVNEFNEASFEEKEYFLNKFTDNGNAWMHTTSARISVNTANYSGLHDAVVKEFANILKWSDSRLNTFLYLISKKNYDIVPNTTDNILEKEKVFFEMQDRGWVNSWTWWDSFRKHFGYEPVTASQKEYEKFMKKHFPWVARGISGRKYDDICPPFQPTMLIKHPKFPKMFAKTAEARFLMTIIKEPVVLDRLQALSLVEDL